MKEIRRNLALALLMLISANLANISVIRISGDSMQPTILDGDVVVAIHSRVFRKVRGIRNGDIVVAIHPLSGHNICKRVKLLRTDSDEPKSVILVGDNPRSSEDSRVFGEISIDLIKGLVLTTLRLRER